MIKIGRFSFDEKQAKKMSTKEFTETFKNAEKVMPRGITLEEIHKKYCGIIQTKVTKKES